MQSALKTLQESSKLRISKYQTQIPFKKENIYKEQNILSIYCEILYSGQERGFPTLIWYIIYMKILIMNYKRFIRICNNFVIIYYPE